MWQWPWPKLPASQPEVKYHPSYLSVNIYLYHWWPWPSKVFNYQISKILVNEKAKGTSENIFISTHYVDKTTRKNTCQLQYIQLATYIAERTQRDNINNT
jgi:hypothetical protein